MIISIVPLIIYFLIMACICGRSHSVLLSGIQDRALLLFGIAGMIFIGPIMFLVPINALMFWGSGIWPVLVLFYFLVAFLIVSNANSWGVFYNADRTKVIEILSAVAEKDQIEISADNKIAKMSEEIYLLLQESKFFGCVTLSLIGQPTTRQLEQWRQILYDLKKESVNLKRESKKSAFICLSFVFFLVITVFYICFLKQNV